MDKKRKHNMPYYPPTSLRRFTAQNKLCFEETNNILERAAS
ncbi:hypothetical protein NC651_004947 [Populus alba x Populus x berolinensis]|nr:hypothetical protein NC651_004947 [Populus alba x Populus x berolinensis]